MKFDLMAFSIEFGIIVTLENLNYRVERLLHFFIFLNKIID